MKISETDILIVPGAGGSDPGHWQQRWAGRFPAVTVIAHADWSAPDLGGWVDMIERAVVMSTRPVVLIAHSLGVPATVHTAARLADTKVRGAFLVAPPDLEGNPEVRAEVPAFAPMPRDPLPFPSMLVASTTDPWCEVDVADDLANCWGSEFHLAGDAGHIDTASGHGPWPEGLMMFTRLMQRLKG